ncbi:nitrous oxide reductase family maturation protein NosD [Acidobacteriota bacterium]
MSKLRTIMWICLLAVSCPALVQAAEGRIPIPFESPVTFPIIIDEGGHYFLTRDLTSASGTVVSITDTADTVVLDLNGFTLSSGDATGPVISIVASLGGQTATVLNGFVSGGQDGVWANRPVVIDNVSVSGSGRHGISIDGYDAVVRGCQVTDTVETGILYNGRDSSDAHITNNTIRNPVGVDGIGVSSSKGGSLIEGNTITSVTEVNIHLTFTNNATVSKNRLVGGGNRVVYLDRCYNVRVEDNTIQGPADTCIDLEATHSSNIAGNHVKECTIGMALRPISTNLSAGNFLADNVVADCTSGGIVLEDSHLNLFANNLVLFNRGGWGVWLQSPSQNNTFRANTIYWNQGGPASNCSGWATDNEFCDESSLTQWDQNFSAGDNLMPPWLGPL